MCRTLPQGADEKGACAMDGVERVEDRFEPTRTILSSSALFDIPEILQDEGNRLWSYKAARRGKRVVLSYDDIESCDIIEGGSDSAAPRPEGMRGVLSVLANPGKVSRDNAARKGDVCLGMSVSISLRPPLAAALSIPIWKRPVRRTERLYREIRGQAEAIKAVFDAMVSGGDDGGETD